MNLCILAKTEDVNSVRAKALEGFPELKGHTILSLPLSPTGNKPATHFFCSMNTTEEIVNKLMGLKDLSIMETTDAKSFLAKHNLKYIRSNNV